MSEAHVKCTRVCKHFELVFRCAAVDCSTAARFRRLLRLRLIVRRQMLSSFSSPRPPRPLFVPPFLPCDSAISPPPSYSLFHSYDDLAPGHPRALLTLRLTGPSCVRFLPDSTFPHPDRERYVRARVRYFRRKRVHCYRRVQRRDILFCNQ